MMTKSSAKKPDEKFVMNFFKKITTGLTVLGFVFLLLSLVTTISGVFSGLSWHKWSEGLLLISLALWLVPQTIQRLKTKTYDDPDSGKLSPLASQIRGVMEVVLILGLLLVAGAILFW